MIKDMNHRVEVLIFRRFPFDSLINGCIKLVKRRVAFRPHVSFLALRVLEVCCPVRSLGGTKKKYLKPYFWASALTIL